MDDAPKTFRMRKTKSDESFQYLKKAGINGVHILKKDWSSTDLGEIVQWSDDLKIALGVILASPIPKILCWGKNLICLYNRVFINKIIGLQEESKILGKPLSESFPQIWEKLKSPVKNYFDNNDNAQIEIKNNLNLADGATVEYVFTCNPVFDANGDTMGIILSARPGTIPLDEQIDQPPHLLQQVIKSAPVGIFTLSGEDFRISMVNSTFLNLTGNKEKDLIHQPFFDKYPRIKEKFQPILRNVLRSGESFYGEDIVIPISFNKVDRFFHLNIVLQPIKSEGGKINSLMAVVIDVTRIAEEKKLLVEKEFQFRKMVKDSKIAILLLKGPNYVIEYGNDLLFHELFLIKPENAIGKRIVDLLPLKQNMKFISELDFVYNSGITIKKSSASTTIVREEKLEEYFFDYDISPIKNEQSIVTGIMVNFYDVTENVLSKIKLQESQQRLEMSLDAGGLAIWEIDLPAYKMTYSSRLAKILQLDNLDISLDKFRTIIHPDYRNELNNVLKRALETGEYYFECQFLTKNQSTGWIRIRGKVFFDDNGNPIKILGFTRDITEEKEKQLNLQRREQRLRHLILEAPVAIGILRGPDYKVEIINEVATKLLGKSKTELEGMPLLEVMKEVNTDIAKSLLDQVYYHDKSISGTEYPVKLFRNGQLEKVYVHFEYDPLKNSEGKTIGVMVVGFDVTNQVLIRKKIEENELRFRLLANTAPNFVCSINQNNEISFINQTFQRYTGLTLEEINKQGIFIALHPDDIEKAKVKWEYSIKKGIEFIDEHRIRDKSGIYRWHITRAIPERNDYGKPTGWIATSTDIQEIKEQEIQKDYFISRASHELKTPITSLKGYIQILQSILKETDDKIILHSLTRMNLQVEKLTRLIEDLLSTTKMTRKGLILHKQKFNLWSLIHEIVDDVKFMTDYNIVFDQPKSDAHVLGDKEKLGRVITNLLTNAIKYSPDSHTVWIKATRRNDTLRISVIDHGIGIEKKEQQNIFEKFYRVRGKNEDTFPGFGIGLFITNEILKNHNTKLHVKSEPGKGSTFYFDLPLIVKGSKD